MNNTDLTNKILQDLLDQLTNEQHSEINVLKVVCNKVFLDQLRDKGIPENLLKIIVINYEQLNT